MPILFASTLVAHDLHGDGMVVSVGQVYPIAVSDSTVSPSTDWLRMLCSGQFRLSLYIVPFDCSELARFFARQDDTARTNEEYSRSIHPAKRRQHDELVGRLYSAISSSQLGLIIGFLPSHPRFRNIPSGQVFTPGTGNYTADYSLQLMIGWENFQAWANPPSPPSALQRVFNALRGGVEVTAPPPPLRSGPNMTKE